MSISAVRNEVPQPQQPVATAPAFKGEGEEKKGTGLFLPLVAGAATGGVTYYLGSKPTAEAIAKLDGEDKFIKSLDTIKDATDVEKGAVQTIKDNLGKIKDAADDTAKKGILTPIEEAMKTLGEKLPKKIQSIKSAAIWGGVALAGTYILAKIFGGKKEA